MTDAPPPSIPPSIPPRKRPSATPAGTWGVTTVPGRGGPDGTGRPPAGEAAPPLVVPEAGQATRRTPTSEPRDVRPAPGAAFPVVGPPGAPSPAVASPRDDEIPEGPSPLATAVEHTGQWLKKAASATGASMSAAYASLTRPRSEDDAMTANPHVTGAPPRPVVPPTAPAMTAGTPTVRPASGRTPVVGGPGPRRVRLAVSRLDPWSVMKLAFLMSFAAGIMLVVAVSVLWLTLDGLHVFTSLNNLVTQIVGQESSINILTYVQFSKVLSITTLVAVIDVLLLTALATIGAFLYNVVAALVGGVHVTMTDE
ncbi:MAG: hypothetical protein BGO37_15650 [Cellulomonas sp. 73-92]|uniref:DUF3566 domain-containing protein n=1 Tax=Cellulomonas sp. 73-92 TaxID=1895740 RepID=UPI000929DDCC|nr:DUF3566 domain-containing protein [Cellulomonas sp. 73-92]OJV80950.1 MAG: hypothetical protein BGO37_15650 [Cellulomonas sp. 73-92]